MGFRETLRAALASDGEASPQARDERQDAWGATIDVDRKTPDRGSIEEWVNEYEENVLIRKPTQTFTSDVLEPGYRCTVGDSDDEDIPTVPETYPDSDYHGLDLDEALEKWLSEAGIVDGEYEHDFEDVLEKHLKDKVGKRGTSMVEIVYDDPSEQNRIMGLRPFKVETITAYTLEGKSILLRPDDTAEEVSIEATSTQSLGSGERTTLPKTRAGETACYVQFDDVFGTKEADEVRLSQSDVVKDARDADTGDVFGLPDTASVYDRAKAIRQQYKDLDHALKTLAYKHWLVEVGTSNKSKAKELLKGIDPSNPEKVNVINYPLDNIDTVGGDVPDIDDTLKQEIEYVLSAFPVPIYRIGFEGDINRDVTSEQGDDYTRELSDERDRIESAFQPVLERKAREFLDGGAPEVALEIRPEEDENPLHDEEFDASEFKATMDALSTAGVVLPRDYILETFLGVDADEIDELEEAPLPEDDPRVQESFRDSTDPPEPAEGD